MNQPDQPNGSSSKGSSAKGLLAVLAMLVVCAGVALGIFVWPKISGGDSSTAAEGYVSAKDASAQSKLTRTTRAPEEDANRDSSAEEDSNSQEPTSTSGRAQSLSESASTQGDREESGNSDAVASNNRGGRPGHSGSVCDGRAVLILHSVVDYGNAQQEVNAALAQHPGTRVFQPGECSSLRASIDGHPIYAIARDYGNDIASLCRDAAVQGGNPRTLNNNADFASPCG